MTRATDSEKEMAFELWARGLSQYAISHEIGRHQSTVHRWLKSAGKLDDDAHLCNMKKAVEAHIIYNLKQRIELNNDWFDKIKEFMAKIETPSDLRTVATAYGIIEDKRHLLEPLVINTNEKSGLEEIREDLRVQRKSEGELDEHST